MKRYGNLFEKCCSMENLYRAHQNASKGKRHYREVKMVNSDRDKYLESVQKLLKSGGFKTSPYMEMRKNEYGKERKIHKLPYFPDRIVHHAIVQVVSGIWHRTLIRDTYACVVGRGIHDGVRRVKKALMDRDCTQFCLKMDVKQFYPSLDHGVLRRVILAKLKDKRLLSLLDEIIDSFPAGVPIGNYLSQFFGNLYLSRYDHFMKDVCKCRYYFRYCDDVVVLDADKNRLHQLRRITASYWKDRLMLQMKNNWQVFPVDIRGIDFLGYRFFHGYMLLRKSIAIKAKRKIRTIKKNHFKMAPVAVLSSITGYNGWMQHANCLNFKKAIFDIELQKIVAKAAKSASMRFPVMFR